jgi:hypothetical protein
MDTMLKVTFPDENSLAKKIKSPLLLPGTTHVRTINVLYYIVQCWVFLIGSDHQLYRVTPLKTPFGLLSLLFQSQSHVTTITHNYFSCGYAFTQLTILLVRDYNHLLHSYTG